MAHRLAREWRDKVCLLERGKPWPPGSFPRTPLQFERAMWAPSQGLHGMYDVWSFRGLNALISSGLGGGSLLYANVMLKKDANTFFEPTVYEGPQEWPITRATLDPHYANVLAMMQPELYPDHLVRITPKARAFRAAAGPGLIETPLAVRFPRENEEPGTPFGDPADNYHRRQRYTCRLVGECDVGCNYGAKHTLDYTYISEAERDGAQILCRHEVKAFAPDEDGYVVEVVDHSNAVEGRPPRFPPPRKTLRTRRLILCAGALGTPFLLFSNRSAFPRISPMLGTRFSGNGDFIAFAARCRDELEPAIGPVITSAIQRPTHYVEDGGYANFLAFVGQMLNTPRLAWGARRVALQLLWHRLIGKRDRNLGFVISELLGDPRVIAGTLPMLGIGREPPQGLQVLRDGLLDIEYSMRIARPYFDGVARTVAEVTDRLGGQFESNVLWRLNATITVHPLGGCPMGRTAEEGVVDPVCGQVHNYPGLHVADGSVMPGTVGANPSLTIAAVADLFADGILEGRCP